MKQRIYRLALFLLLGAILNIAVAWGCELWRPQGPLTEPWNVSDESVVRTWTKFLPNCNADSQDLYGEESAGNGHRYFVVTGYCLCHPGVDAVIEVSAGWPMHALDGQAIFKQSGRFERHWLCHTAFISEHIAIDSFRALPLRPMWLGFTVNTTFYAAILWMLFAFPFAWRRRQRIKRGLCPACGYDLRQIPHRVCPECGMAVSKTS